MQTNELADWVAKHYQTIAPYTKSILAVAIAVLVGYCAWSFISSRSQEQVAAEWDHFDGGKEELNGLISRHSIGTPLGNVAHLSLADINLSEGLDALLKDRAEALRLLKAASDEYSLVANASTDPMLVNLAWSGKAKAEESMGDLEAARTDYKRLLGNSKLAVFDDYAKQRLAELQRPSIQDFYAVLAESQSKLPETPGTPGTRPSTDLDVPKEKLLPDSLLDKSPIFGTTPDETKKPPDDKTPLFPAPEKTDDKAPVTPQAPEAAPEKSAAPKTPETPVAKTPDKTPTPKTPAAKTPKK